MGGKEECELKLLFSQLKWLHVNLFLQFNNYYNMIFLCFNYFFMTAGCCVVSVYYTFETLYMQIAFNTCLNYDCNLANGRTSVRKRNYKQKDNFTLLLIYNPIPIKILKGQNVFFIIIIKYKLAFI